MVVHFPAIVISSFSRLPTGYLVDLRFQRNRVKHWGLPRGLDKNPMKKSTKKRSCDVSVQHPSWGRGEVDNFLSQKGP